MPITTIYAVRKFTNYFAFTFFFSQIFLQFISLLGEFAKILMSSNDKATQYYKSKIFLAVFLILSSINGSALLNILYLIAILEKHNYILVLAFRTFLTQWLAYYKHNTSNCMMTFH